MMKWRAIQITIIIIIISIIIIIIRSVSSMDHLPNANDYFSLVNWSSYKFIMKGYKYQNQYQIQHNINIKWAMIIAVMTAI